jgi:nicotinamide mononucleotide transporter
VTSRVAVLLGLAASAAVLLLPVFFPRQELLQPLEPEAAVTGAWSVALLARNRPLGWWVGLVSVALYAVVFHRVGLYAEVGLQGFYFVTSLQALWLWRRGGAGGTERPVTRAAGRELLATVVFIGTAGAGLYLLNVRLGAAAPAVDALVAVLSVAAHLLLMARRVESWWLWLLVDTLCVPLYAWRGLWASSLLYAVFWGLALRGLLRFRTLADGERGA